MTDLNINNLTVTIEDIQILSDVSLNIKRGNLVGLIGPNGAGKSILLKSILGLIEGAEGDITLDEKNITDWTIKERGQKIAYAAQGAPVHWPLTVGHLVSLGRIPHLTPWQSTNTEDQDLTLQAMKRTDVDHLAARNTTTLSGGERARAMLARAMLTTWKGASSRRLAHVVAEPCLSASIRSTRWPWRARQPATFTDRVVLPTPPFWFRKDMIMSPPHHIRGKA